MLHPHPFEYLLSFDFPPITPSQATTPSHPVIPSTSFNTTTPSDYSTQEPEDNQVRTYIYFMCTLVSNLHTFFFISTEPSLS